MGAVVDKDNDEESIIEQLDEIEAEVVAAKNWKAISDKCEEALGYIAKARG